MKKLIAILICAAITLSAPASFTALDEQPAASQEQTQPAAEPETQPSTENSTEQAQPRYAGLIGNNLEFFYNTETAELTISGDGTVMLPFEQGNTPWYPYASQIKKLTLNTPNLKNISSYAFEGIASLKEFTVPATVLSVGQGAFKDTSLEKLTLKNKSAAIFDSADSVPAKATICCYKSSKAYKYAVKYKRKAYLFITKIKHPDTNELLTVGEKYTLETELTPVEAEENITWHTDNKKIATVSKKGVVTAKKKGSCYVYAVSKDDKKVESSKRVKIIVTDYSFTKMIHTLNNSYKKHRAIAPKGIVIHSTEQNSPSAYDYAVNWNTPKPEGREVDYHGFIGKGKDDSVQFYQTLPFNMACRGIGSGSKGSYNFNPGYIQFMCCEDNLDNQSYFITVYNQATDLCAYLCVKYNIPTEKIVGHYEAYRKGYGSPHADPQNWFGKFGYSMKKFRSTVKKKIKAIDPNADLTSSKIYPKHKLVKKAVIYKKKLADDYGKSVKTVATLKKDTKIKFIYDCGGGWSRVKYDGKKGYLRNDKFEREYLSVFSKKKLAKTAAFYTRPTAKAKYKAKTVEKGKKVKIISVITSGKKKGWTMVKRGTKDYYVKTKKFA